MATRASLHFHEKENSDSAKGALSLKNKHHVDHGSFQSSDIKKKGLGLRLGNENTHVQTPRKALGDVKNVQQALTNSNKKQGKISPQPLKPLVKSKPGKAESSLKKQPPLCAIPEAKVVQDSDSEDEIETMHIPLPEKDTFEDLLGPVHSRLSSVPGSAWNALLKPVVINTDLSEDFFNIFDSDDDWRVPRDSESEDEEEGQSEGLDESTSLANLFLEN